MKVVEYKEQDVASMQMALNSITVTGAEQARILVVLDNVLRRGVVKDIPEPGGEGSAGASEKEGK